MPNEELSSLLNNENRTLNNYSDREGYSKKFLEELFNLPVNREIIENALVINEESDDPIEKYILKYEHFSIMMNKVRRLAIYTACNVDGLNLKNSNDGISSSQNWKFDSRIKEEYQIGNELYEDNPLDRGHLVRRLDPVWGDLSVAKKANKDSFHFTNCCPQHKKLNRKLWRQLEDFILKNADVHDLKLSVFTGPIFSENDKEYGNIKIPNEFWKIVIIKFKDEDNFSATGYLLSQKNLIDSLRAFTPEQAMTYQVPIRRITELTNIDFRNLVKYDPLERIRILRTRNFKIIEKITDIVL